jgi:hypothetical protein
MDEAVIYAVGLIVTFFVFRWIIKGGNSSSPTSGANYDVIIRRMREMFPRVPEPVLKDALQRANYQLEEAIDYLISTGTTGTFTSATTSDRRSLTPPPTEFVQSFILFN